MSAPPSALHRLRRLLLRAAARLPLTPTHRPSAPPARLLVIRPDSLGDIVLATPAMARLRADLPSAHLTVAAGPWAAGVLDHGPAHDERLLLPFPGFPGAARRGPLAPYALLLAEARRLRAGRYDAALILRPDHWWGAALVWAAGIPRRFGFAVPEVAPFCTDTLPKPLGLHTAAENLALVDLLLGHPGPAAPTAAPLVWRSTPAERVAASALLSPLTGAGPLVALQPGAGGVVKQWRTERWVGVLRSLESDGARFVLTGGPAERALTSPIAEALARSPVLDLAGRTDLGTLAAVFAGCALVLGVDSGGLHVASAVAPRTLRLYGPTDPARFGPWGDPKLHLALWAGLRCPLCGNLGRTAPCAPDCMGAIGVESVVAVARALLADAT